MNHYNLVHKFIPIPQAMKIPDAEAAVDKDWKKLETIPALAAGRIRPNWNPWGSPKVRRRLLHPTAKCKHKKERQCLSKNWIYSWQWCFSMIHRLFSHAEHSAKITGYSYEWTSGQKPQLIEDGRRIKCSTENHIPIVVPGLSTGPPSSAAPSSPTSVPQEAVIPTLHSASTETWEYA